MTETETPPGKSKNTRDMKMNKQKKNTEIIEENTALKTNIQLFKDKAKTKAEEVKPRKSDSKEQTTQTTSPTLTGHL